MSLSAEVRVMDPDVEPSLRLSNIQQIYERLTLTTSYREGLENHLQAELKAFTADTRQQRERLSFARLEIERTQQKLLEAHYSDAIPLEVLRREQKALERELSEITQDLDSLDIEIRSADRLISQALDLAEHTSSTYKNATDQVRRQLNQIFFNRLLVHIEGTGEHQLTTDLKAPFDLILAPTTKRAISTAANQPTGLNSGLHTKGSKKEARRPLSYSRFA